MIIDMSFPVFGPVLPEDNGYNLYAAISHILGDHLPDGINYFSLYRLTTPERVFFFEAAHRITRLPGDAVELDISVCPFDKVGDFVYPLRQSSEFSAAEIAHIRDLIAHYLKTDREALHPVYAPAERVRSVRVRLP